MIGIVSHAPSVSALWVAGVFALTAAVCVIGIRLTLWASAREAAAAVERALADSWVIVRYEPRLAAERDGLDD